MDPHYKEKMVAALRREREGYVARDLTDRVQKVDKQLAAFGASADGDSAGSDEEPTEVQPRGRRQARQETA